MTYLLDVNALIALGLREHEFHKRVGLWVRGIGGASRLATTPITELGFTRIVTQASAYGFTVADAQTVLDRLKDALSFAFLPDDHEARRLPKWVAAASQVTDGHLVELARANDAVLATLDAKIPTAFVIPSQLRR